MSTYKSNCAALKVELGADAAYHHAVNNLIEAARDVVTACHAPGKSWTDLNEALGQLEELVMAKPQGAESTTAAIITLLAERNTLLYALEPFLMSYSQEQLEQLANVENGLGEISPLDARRQLKARAAIGAVAMRRAGA